MELSYFWPREMTDTVTLHKTFENGKGLVTEEVLQRSPGFDVFLKTTRNTMSERIRTRFVYLDMRAIEDQSYENGHLVDDELMTA